MQGNEPFYGTECEGKYVGLETLFIPFPLLEGTEKTLAFIKGLHCEIHHIYFGAGGNPLSAPRHFEQVDQLLRELDNVRVKTIEVGVNAAHLIPSWMVNNPKIRIIITVGVGDFANVLRGFNTEVKFVHSYDITIYGTPSQQLPLAYNTDRSTPT